MVREVTKCPSCNVNVSCSHSKCPLCRKPLKFKSNDCQKEYINPWYPSYKNFVIKEQKNFVGKLFAFLAISTISICTLVNLIAGGDYWVLYIVPSVLYAWLLTSHTILSRSHIGSKIVFQVFGVSGFMIWVNIVKGGSRWSVNYVIPFLIVGAILLITIISLSKRMRWREFTGYLIALILLGIVPIILYLFGVSQVFWAAAISALYAILTLVGLFIFARRSFKNELGRIFHF